MASDLRELVVRLQRGGVEFVLVGGFGAAAHGGGVTTLDVDVACQMDSKNLVRLFETFSEFCPVHRMTPQRIEFTREQAEKGELKNLYLSTTLGQLDCLGDIKGIGGYAECLSRSEAVSLGDVEIRVLSLEAMIDAKLAMGRPRDLQTAEELKIIWEKQRK